MQRHKKAGANFGMGVQERTSRSKKIEEDECHTIYRQLKLWISMNDPKDSGYEDMRHIITIHGLPKIPHPN